jgi:hypothetical protein
MIEDSGSPAKAAALLRERLEAFWTASVKGEYEKTYYLYDPFFRARTNIHLFLGKRGAIKYKSFEIKDIKVDENVAHVSVNIIYEVPKVKFKKQEFSQPETSAAFEETWLFIYDNWYKEFKSEASSTSIVNY